jgi:hypothetical protein
MRYRFVELSGFIILAQALLAVPVPSSHAAPAVWSSLELCGPSARKHHTMIYDEEHNCVVLYGGENHNISSEHPFDDLWVLHLDGVPYWEEFEPGSGQSRPLGLHGHSAVYDEDGSRMLIISGREDLHSTPVYSQETWSLDLDALNQRTVSWTNLNQDFPSGSVEVCFDTFRDVYLRNHSVAGYVNGLIVMGGRAGETALQDTWELTDNGWELRWGDTLPLYNPMLPPCNGSSEFPARRYWHSMIKDGQDRLIVFGGVYPDNQRGDGWSDTWALTSIGNNVSWEYLNEPSSSFARNFHAAVYDDLADRMIIVGGYREPQAQITGDVTELDPIAASGTWTKLTEISGAGPGAIAEHAAVFDSENNRVIVFGGVNGSGQFIADDTFILDFSADVTPPEVVDLNGTRGKTKAVITWTAPGDDGATGTAAEYDLRRSTSMITDCNFALATRCTTGTPQSAGSEECASITGLTACQTYYYALRTRDDAGNWSPISNVISLTQKCSGTEVICLSGSNARTPVIPVPGEYAVRTTTANGRTTLFVDIPSDRQGQMLEVAIFNVAGATVRKLVEENAVAGELEIPWDHRAEGGGRVAGGIYFARVRLGNEARTSKIMVSDSR